MPVADVLLEHDHPYACPLDRTPLRAVPGGVACSLCGAQYRSANGILLLDVIASAQAAAFDAQHASAGPMSEDARRASVALAERFLDALEPGTVLDGKTVLEVACGGGALTYGLVHSPRMRRTAVHGFDHSTAALAALRASLDGEPGGNALFLSAQDVHAPAYRARTFDAIFGNAVLHHFSRVGGVIASLAHLLRSGGVAVFAEPFALGYVLATTVLVQAASVLGRDLGGPDCGLAQFIVDDVGYRVRNAHDDAALEHLIDKHLFTTDAVAEIAARHGLAWRTLAFEPARSYERFMQHFLDEYRIADPSLRATALGLYAAALANLGPALGELFPHFRFIVLTKTS
jgi:SAM-dependent methyltransferase